MQDNKNMPNIPNNPHSGLYTRIVEDTNRQTYRTTNIPCNGIVHTVKKGETLWLISQTYKINFQDLLAANPQIVDLNNITIGQEICVPVKGPITPEVRHRRESLTYLYGGNSSYYLDLLDKTNDSITTVCPDYFDIDQNGNLLLASSAKLNKGFIDELHRRNIKVVPFISNHWDRKLGVQALVNRDKLSSQIATAIEQHNLDGVDVDIENVTDEHRTMYTDFVRLLKKKLPVGKIVSVAVAANPNGWTVGWHGSYDYKNLANYADYLMIMNYDESYQGGPEGPVASSTFFTKSIQYALNQGVPKEKIVVGIPFFGRYWKVGSVLGGIGITAKNVEYLIKNYDAVTHYDESAESAFAVVTIKPSDPEPTVLGNRKLTAGVYRIWYDNERAVYFKLSTINSFDVKGAGSWALGQENTDIWNFYTDALNGLPVTLPEIPGPEPVEPGPGPIGPSPTEPPTLPELTGTNIEKIIAALEIAGDSRPVNENTILTRGEASVALAILANIQPDTGNAFFIDIAEYWGKGYINALYNLGILKGRDDNKFYPNQAITKEELTVILDSFLNLPRDTNAPPLPFKDVEPNRWSYNQIATLYHYNIVERFNNNFFGPSSNMTVKDLADILDRIDMQGLSIVK